MTTIAELAKYKDRTSLQKANAFARFSLYREDNTIPRKRFFVVKAKKLSEEERQAIREGFSTAVIKEMKIE